MSQTSSGSTVRGLDALARVFSAPQYRLLFAMTSVTMASQWMLRIAQGWLLWELTGSGGWLGFLAMAELAPGLVLGPVGGVLADRMDRRRLVGLCQVVVAAVSAATGLLVLFGGVTPVLLVCLAACAGSAAALQEASRSLLLRDVTPSECLPTGMSLTAISVNVTRFLGPAIAGPLIANVGPSIVFWINTVSALLLLVVVSRLSAQAEQAAGRGAHFMIDLWRGVAAAASHPVITPVLVIFAVTAIAVRPLYELMPAFASGLFGGSVEDYSQLVMAVGVGAVVGAVIVTLHASARPARLFMWSSLGAAFALIGFAFARETIGGLAAAAVLGFFMCISAATSQLTVILDADQETGGRVLSVWSTLMRAGPAIGAVVMGLAVDVAGYRIPLWCGAGLTILALTAIMLAGERRRRAPAPETPL
ncbi:MAG: MFS transporter [Hyphomonadaceae bacterium]